jgi:hypothetical protein
MPLIDKSYFVGELNIPNTGQLEVEDSLNHFIKKRETEFLRLVLGYPLYKAFLAGYSATAKYQDLLNGKEYTDTNGLVQKWDGFRQKEAKQSIVANYTYFYWQKDQATLSAGVGEVKPKAKNAVIDSPANKMIRAWNEIQPRVKELFAFIKANREAYPEWDSNSEYQVLMKLKPINRFGI